MIRSIFPVPYILCCIHWRWMVHVGIYYFVTFNGLCVWCRGGNVKCFNQYIRYYPILLYKVNSQTWFNKWRNYLPLSKKNTTIYEIWWSYYDIGLLLLLSSSSILRRLLMDHEKIILFNFEQGSKRGPNFEILHIWKVYLTLFNTNSKTRQKSKIQFVQLITLSNTLCQANKLLMCTFFNFTSSTSCSHIMLHSV